jgi:flagellar export protein FliJ
MPFHFPLETVLRFRRSLERQKELRLLEALRQVMAVKQGIEAVDRCAADILEDQHREMARAVPAAQLHFDRLRFSILKERRLELGKVLAQREEVFAHCQKEFFDDHRARESVEVLRQHQLQIYQQEERRREQRRLDDLFLLRREYLLRR